MSATSPYHAGGVRPGQSSPDDDAWAGPLVYPAGAVEFGRMVQVVGMLLLCRSRAERFIVGLCVWHGRPAADAAAATGLLARQVSELLASLRARLDRVARRAQGEAELSRLLDGSHRRRRTRRRTRPPHVELRDAPDLDDDDDRDV